MLHIYIYDISRLRVNVTDVPQPPKNANVANSKLCKVTESFLCLTKCCECADVSSLCSYSKNVAPNKVESWIPCSVIVCWCQGWYGQKSAQSIYCPVNGALQVQGLLQLYIHKSVHPVTSLFVYSWPPRPSTVTFLRLSPAYQRRRNGSKGIILRKRNVSHKSCRANHFLFSIFFLSKIVQF